MQQRRKLSIVGEEMERRSREGKSSAMGRSNEMRDGRGAGVDGLEKTVFVSW